MFPACTSCGSAPAPIRSYTRPLRGERASPKLVARDELSGTARRLGCQFLFAATAVMITQILFSQIWPYAPAFTLRSAVKWGFQGWGLLDSLSLVLASLEIALRRWPLPTRRFL